ncbi:MAG: V-type ATP synthase subunit I [Clostridiales bacterium]|nr:V-type ATP synthase subunit I [Clostridiales bacterium]
MAIAKMSHLRLVGLKRDQNKIMDVLVGGGLFEARATDPVPFELQSGESGRYGELKLKQSEISFALGFLKARHAFMAGVLEGNKRAEKTGEKQIEYTLSRENYSDARRLITKADFSDAAAREYELMQVCDDLKELSFKLVDYSARVAELNSEAQAYAPYAVMPIKFSELHRDGDIVISMYSGKASLQAANAALDGMPCAYELRVSKGVTVALTVARRNGEADVEKALSAIGFVKCEYTDDCTAADKLAALQGETDDIQKQILDLTKTALDYEKYVNDLRILYDVIELDIERVEAERGFLKSDNTFVLEGWLPERVAESTVEQVKQTSDNVFVQLLAPEDRDKPPTLVENNRVVKPYEQITDMYSSPRYREIDPNPIMAVFYFLFFGIMIGDAGYGLILAIAGLVVGTRKKFDVGIKRLALLVGMGGISAIIWGVLFGGYFSIDFGETKVALLLNPLDKPLLLLVLSIGFGIIQIVTGFVIKFVSLCKDGKPFSAIFDCGSIILLFIALILLAIGALPSLAPMLGIEVNFAPPKGLSTAAIVLAVTGVALILLFGGRNSNNIFGKIVGGFKGLYGLVNLVSDLLSYCRLFGLCLASCAIGLAFNSLGEILMGIPVAGYVLGAIVLSVLHIFNLALGVLSAYVHDARLQFLEFYGKFYDGGGRLFAPMGAKTKYIRYN